MLITFEGIDGSGKSTQAGLLVDRLRAAGRTVLLVREPGGTDVSERVRALLLDPALHVEPLAELLLFSAARAQLVRERIRPALEAGHVVVCDRFFDSTTAYQGGARGVADEAWLRDFNAHVTGGLVPDRTYLVALDAETAARRRAERTAEPADRMEAGGRAFLERVAAAYDRLAAAEPDRIHRLDGREAVETLHDRIWNDVAACLERRGTRVGSTCSPSPAPDPPSP